MISDEIPSNTIQRQTLQKLNLPDSVNLATYTLTSSPSLDAGITQASLTSSGISGGGIYPVSGSESADATLGNREEICFRKGANLLQSGNITTAETMAERALNPLRLTAGGSAGRKMISKYRLRKAAGDLLPEFRVHLCNTCLVPYAGNVPVYRRDDGKSASYGNLLQCDSVHICPVCAERLTLQSRLELELALEHWRASGGRVYMITRTSQHTAADSLKCTMARQLSALRKMKGSRAYTALAKRTGIEHTIRNLEATYGEENGWHPHTHELVFTRKRLLVARLRQLRRVYRLRSGSGNAKRARAALSLIAHKMRAQYGKLWRAAIAREGGYADVAHGLEVTADSEAIRDYVSKQALKVNKLVGDLSSELALAKKKRGRLNGRYTPFQLLTTYASAPESEAGKHAGAKFREYAFATKGRSHLHWSKGAKLALGVTEQALEQSLEQALEQSPVYAVLSLPVWNWIKENQLQGEVLALAMEHENLQNFISELRALGAPAEAPIEAPVPAASPLPAASPAPEHTGTGSDPAPAEREAPERYSSGTGSAPAPEHTGTGSAPVPAERARQLRLIYPPPQRW